ncbi:MAG: 6-hydroxymethylpterin diphosphokinase MptE-like protein [Promethearchaeota archaeon]
MLPRFQIIIKDEEFSEKYRNIIRILGLSNADDRKSRNLLFSILSQSSHGMNALQKNFMFLESLFQTHDRIIIFGGGPDVGLLFKLNTMDSGVSLAQTIEKRNLLIIAVDGATEILYQNNIIPQIIFTDLDGIRLKTVSRSEFKSTLFIIHAHGDNINKLVSFKDFVSKHRFVIGTTQVQTKFPVINHGGFTDGDRALYLIGNFLKKEKLVYFIGYDFGYRVGQHSKPHYTDNRKANKLKREKLKLGAEITAEMCSKWPCPMRFLELEAEINPIIQKIAPKSKYIKIKIKNNFNFRKIINMNCKNL